MNRLLLFILIFTNIYCSKTSINNQDNLPPVEVFAFPSVNTDSIVSITNTSANCIGSIKSDGGLKITAKGFVWSTSINPTTELNTKTNEGSGNLSFNSTISNLTLGTKYYIRAYATNTKGTTYGKEVNFTTSNTKVYVTGQFGGNSMLWLNGVEILNEGPNNSINSDDVFFNSMTISGNDTYIVGTKRNRRFKATLWKNGLASNLDETDTTYVSGDTTFIERGTEANSIFVSGNDIYIAGNQLITCNVQISNVSSSSTNFAKAGFWKNGIRTNLTDGHHLAGATSVCVVGTDVYVTGYEINAFGNFIAKVWKNGIATDLSKGDRYVAVAYSVKNIGQDIYIGSYDYGIAKIWKNGVASNLNQLGGTTLTSMSVSGNDVYAAGYTDTVINSYSTSVGKVWKNGLPMSIISDGVNKIELWSIYVFGNDVYVCGRNYINDSNSPDAGKFIACVWKNGSFLMKLNGELANSIFVQ